MTHIMENENKDAVQYRTFNYFAWPQSKLLNLFLNVIAIQKNKKGLSVVSDVLRAWMSVRFPYLMLSQSCPVLLDGPDTFVS